MILTVRNRLFLFLFGACISCLSFKAEAQIVDDTTRQIYSPTTTRIIYEQDFLRGQYRSHIVDTTLTNMHRERHWFRDTTFYQDLGNVGTAAQPVLWQFPARIGARLGKNIFDRYARDPARIAYFDTKSPYSHLRYVQGDRGQQVFEAQYSRNITPDWNVGLAYDRITAIKQFGPEGGFRDGQIDHVGLLAFSHYRTKDSTYQVFINLLHQGHQQIESGGVWPQATKQLANGDEVPTTRDDLYGYREARIFLNQASNRETRNTIHLAHLYRLQGEHLKVFHVFDSKLQKNTYTDNQIPRLGLEYLYYPRVLLDTLRTLDRTRFFEIENTVGLTGNNSFYLYKLYLKRRDVNYTNVAYDSSRREPQEVDFRRLYTTRLAQHFAGLETGINLPGQLFLKVNGEFQFSGDYMADFSFGLPNLSVSRSMISYEPALTEQVYVSNHFRWRNNFNKSLADQTALHFQGSLGRQSFKLDLAYNRITNYVYFDEQAQPAQYSPSMHLYTATLHHHLKARSIHFDNIIAWSNNDKAPVIPVPALLLNSKVYYEGSIFRNALYGQFGIDTYFTTAYNAFGYMPVTQQFHLQNTFPAYAYPVVDLFLAADIKAVNLFIKVHHLNQGLGAPGYIVTPIYPGMQRSIMLGLKWMFFD
jgi:hypothetical protein